MNEVVSIASFVFFIKHIYLFHVFTHTCTIVHMYRSEQLAGATSPFCHVGPGTKAWHSGLGAAP